MDAHGDPVSLASYLRALGYNATDVAGAVRVRLRRDHGVTIECESDRFRFIPDSGWQPFLMNLWLSWLGLIGAYGVLFGFRDTMMPYLVGFWLPIMAMIIVDELRTDSATNTLRLLAATYATAAQPGVAAERLCAPLNA